MSRFEDQDSTSLSLSLDESKQGLEESHVPQTVHDPESVSMAEDEDTLELDEADANDADEEVADDEAIIDPFLMEKEDIPEDGSGATLSKEAMYSPGEYFKSRSARLEQPDFNEDAFFPLEKPKFEFDSPEKRVREEESLILPITRRDSLLVPKWLMSSGAILRTMTKGTSQTFTVQNISQAIVTVTVSLKLEGLDDAMNGMGVVPKEAAIESGGVRSFTISVPKDAKIESPLAGALLLEALTRGETKTFSFKLSALSNAAEPQHVTGADSDSPSLTRSDVETGEVLAGVGGSSASASQATNNRDASVDETRKDSPVKNSIPQSAQSVELEIRPNAVVFGGVQDCTSGRMLYFRNPRALSRMINLKITGSDPDRNMFRLDESEFSIKGSSEHSVFVRATPPSNDGRAQASASLTVLENETPLGSILLDAYFGRSMLSFERISKSTDKQKSFHLNLFNSGVRCAYVIPVLLGNATVETLDRVATRGFVLQSKQRGKILIEFKDFVPKELTLHWGDEICRRRRRASRSTRTESDRFDAVLLGEDNFDDVEGELRVPRAEDETTFVKQKQVLLLPLPQEDEKDPLPELSVLNLSSRAHRFLDIPETGVGFPRTGFGESSGGAVWIMNKSISTIGWEIVFCPPLIMAASTKGTLRSGRGKPLSFIFKPDAREAETMMAELGDVVLRCGRERYTIPCRIVSGWKVGQPGGRPELTFGVSRLIFSDEASNIKVQLCNKTTRAITAAVAEVPAPYSVSVKILRLPPKSYVRIPVRCSRPGAVGLRSVHNLTVIGSDGCSASVKLVQSG
uniref:Uncharacterized protein n=1 Tax=Rhodosorus marinus TaxID=101924 RepID=A0A7S2ZL11_9RHOD|mmetsp:Transcript_23397/g.92949  ORF Transcript_23397/g.92949 Transcript_23397/m.92949 type:complete len:801 (+) Transcript_23397:291-2693(+)|eukprot:CAMPEP_0113956136 /NCGR_PEP_ID=MMETSP0011_2-20120614/1862_1 /TAXON_ID=101924 /ORGANISM="Rhodosorus marinus" /LENGTH=800 /DNA_ID=CAMNT_0000966185 /DNA_START=121 /DNA_END=2526 /DNA_ORIENTATION=+ /assembly_acc=CAM_ASM_000156